jgi:hypothetical protein
MRLVFCLLTRHRPACFIMCRKVPVRFKGRALLGQGILRRRRAEPFRAILAVRTRQLIHRTPSWMVYATLSKDSYWNLCTDSNFP